ncbi:MAG: hypothetical protein K9I59_05430 [Chlorobium sp.]|uniref:hypothetical protein n=1 Tax=Chlorobium sp. TaxID=1095 RepID=UPI0025C43582|nr:hypothetical protein [Chlorobium sp.]MCF8216217.1 hypothetical protein [Chlorobium sp.]MCF8271119.1 hypothetical protein [Chlorobium sp.]MCF8287493.1 hypothetical protein [Chlorobium sp.]MCF8291032.1 hypothetical protein [Chlorobium sp.]MCF8385127.1 hypothetical protein [Chlorobium sp.]
MKETQEEQKMKGIKLTNRPLQGGDGREKSASLFRDTADAITRQDLERLPDFICYFRP